MTRFEPITRRCTSFYAAVTYQGNSSNRDFGGDQSTADNGKTGAKGVAKDTTNTYAINVFSGS